MRGRHTLSPQGALRFEIDERGQRAVLPLRGEWRRTALLLAVSAAFAGAHAWLTMNEALSGKAYWMIPSAVVAGAVGSYNLLFVLFGRETVAIDRGALVHRWSALGIHRTRRYDMARIDSLELAHATIGPRDKEVDRNAPVSPTRDFGKRGRVRIDCDEETTYIGAAIDEPSARQLIAWLRPYLPRRVVFAEAAPRRFSEMR